MYVEKTAKGHYKFVETYRDRLTMAVKRTSVTYDKNTSVTRKKAERALQNKILMLTSTPTASKMTLSELIKIYNANNTELKESTRRQNAIVLKAVERIIGPNVIVDNLNPLIVQQKLDASGESNTRKNERIKHLKLLIRWGKKKELIAHSDWLTNLPKYKDNPKSRIEDKYMEKDELKAVLEAMTIDKWRLLTAFLALSGLRIGEAICLRPEDVDIAHRAIHVTKTYSIITDTETSTKTDGSSRDVYIQDELMDICNQIKPGKYFFDDNGRFQYPAYKEYLKSVTGKVIGRPLTPHALRHTHTSLLAESGVSLSAISKRLGHSDSKITESVYLHVTERAKQKENALLDTIKLI